MHTLLDCQIVVASAADLARAHGLSMLLEQAGARVRECSLSQDLWTALSDHAIDAVLLCLPEPDAAALVLFEQVRSQARQRGALTCLLTGDARAAATRGAIVLPPPSQGEALLSSLRDLLAPARRLHDAEEQQRALRHELERLREERAEVAHESRSMLSAIMGFASNLRDELPGPLTWDQRQHVAGILEAVERATRLLERSPSSAPVRPSQPPRAQRVLIPLAGLTREVVSLFDAVARRKGLTTQCELDETVHLWGDVAKLKQVVTNLLVNALRYTPAPGRIHVRVAWSSPLEGDGPEARRQALLEIADTGPGVPRDERELIFERGYRARATRDIKGEGIGLSVVKEIVALHGGTIEVGGEVGEGAVFRVDLPQDRRQRALDALAGEHTGERE